MQTRYCCSIKSKWLVSSSRWSAWSASSSPISSFPRLSSVFFSELGSDFFFFELADFGNAKLNSLFRSLTSILVHLLTWYLHVHVSEWTVHKQQLLRKESCFITFISQPATVHFCFFPRWRFWFFVHRASNCLNSRWQFDDPSDRTTRLSLCSISKPRRVVEIILEEMVDLYI